MGSAADGIRSPARRSARGTSRQQNHAVQKNGRFGRRRGRLNPFARLCARLRTKVNKAAGRLSAYYLDTTWETRLPAFKTTAEPIVYQRLPNGTAILDGYPIIWTDVLEPYGTAAAAGKPIAVFGALSFWWMGEHGHPRIDTSDHVLFVNDQLAVRFIEEIDFDYMATDATAALLTAAS